MAEKQTNKDRMREIVDSIENGIKELFESDKYQQYLSTMSRFHRYSVNNTMLIYMQRPDATHVAGFNLSLIHISKRSSIRTSTTSSRRMRTRPPSLKRGAIF